MRVKTPAQEFNDRLGVLGGHLSPSPCKLCKRRSVGLLPYGEAGAARVCLYCDLAAAFPRVA